MLFINTWSHFTPGDTPAGPFPFGIGLEVKLDDVGVADDLGRQGGAAGLPHQGCPVSVLDLQVVKATRGMGLDVEGGEL